MNIAIVSYSLTGNNRKLADYVAKDLSAKHIAVEGKKNMTMGSLMFDMIFARTPKVNPSPDILKQYDFILLTGPIWMGQIASPLRAYLQYIKANPTKYGFISISGGADGDNPKLSGELLKKTGRKPALLIDLHIRNLLSSSAKVTRKETSAYKISEAEARMLSDTVKKEIDGLLQQ